MSGVIKNFSAHAASYDKAACVQPIIAAKLASKLNGNPSRILEIGCGTGGLSIHLAQLFPDAELILTDIAAPMLRVCEQRLSGKAALRLMNGENPDVELGQFDLIVSSMAMQWFNDLPLALSRLARMLKPGGQLAFATLGNGNFPEWRALLDKHDAGVGLHDYPSVDAFPWPIGTTGHIEEECLKEEHRNGAAFLKSLRAIGAAAPRMGYKPLPPEKMRRLLIATSKGFAVTYHVLYGSLTAS